MGRWLASIRVDLLHEIAITIVNALGSLPAHSHRLENLTPYMQRLFMREACFRSYLF
jgi:hypothetical protein